MVLLIVSLPLALLGNNYALAQSSTSGMNPGDVDKSTKQKKHRGGVAPADEDKSTKQEKHAWFDQIDTNHDMKISQNEFIKHRRKRAEEHFKTLDTNNDGSLSLEEWRAHQKEKKGVIVSDENEEIKK